MNLDFSYRISDERLVAWAAVPLLTKLRMLDELRRFTLAVRAAPEVDYADRQSAPPSEAKRS